MRHTLLLALLTFALTIGCAKRNDPVQVVDVGSTFELVSITQTPGWANDVWVQGDTAYIADGEQGVSYFDISDPVTPQHVLGFPLGGLPREHALSLMATNLEGQALLLVIGRTSGLFFFNPITTEYQGNFGSSIISDFACEVVQTDSLHIGTTDFIDDGYGIRRMGYIYNAEFDIWSWTSRENFVAGGTGAFRGIFIDGNTSYLAHSQMGLEIFDMDYSQPDTVGKIGSVDTPGSAYDVTLNGDKTHAIVADYMGGIQIIDITVPSSPAIVGSLMPDKVDQVIKVEAVGDTVYFIDEHNALFAADISNPAAPLLLGNYESPEPTGMFITEDHTVFLTDEDLGLIILEWK